MTMPLKEEKVMAESDKWFGDIFEEKKICFNFFNLKLIR